VPISNFRLNGVSVAFQIRDDRNEIGSFSGVLENKTIRGSYTWRGTKYPFLIARERPGKMFCGARVRRFPSRPSRIPEKISLKARDETLSGILLLPKGDHKHSAVVLLPGSGAFSADSEVPGRPRAHVWEWILADHLARPVSPRCA